MGAPSADQLRLLYIVDRFTHSGNNNKRRWLKGLPLSVLVYHGIQRKIFDDYDWAPSLVEFHGVKMYGKVSQEADADLEKLQHAKLLEKLHLFDVLVRLHPRLSQHDESRRDTGGFSRRVPDGARRAALLRALRGAPGNPGLYRASARSLERRPKRHRELLPKVLHRQEATGRHGHFVAQG